MTDSRFAKVKKVQIDTDTNAIIAKCLIGMSPSDQKLTEGLLNRVDVSYLNGNKSLISDNFIQIVKTMLFLGFFDD